jgi:phosphate transport system protein
MKHTENEIKALKNHHIEMWNLVQGQVIKAYEALRKSDKVLAREIVAKERVVNAQELLVDHHCEDFIALFAPVAVDLRFVISIFKITNNLERIADFAENIALFVLYNQSKPIDKVLYEKLQLEEMMKLTEEMFLSARTALINEDSCLCGKILTTDDQVDKFYGNAIESLAEYITKNPEEALEMLHLNAVIRRIERIGDRAGNIAEDIVFFVEAKELRHQKP